ncbi:MAG: hypothetical protein A3K65_09650 [Euryarchaeota archaeon RBG_16_68_12]|nr:MAG: hypothetical protein A3K65_09650 [Euryarchaeota archaeon RBG_16_68_12]
MKKNLSTTYIIRRLRALGASAFSTREFQDLFGVRPEEAYRVLHRLAGADAVRRIRQGLYVLVAHDDEVLGHSLYLGTRLVEPSYVAFWSALHFRGWTEQAPRVVFIANRRRSGTRAVGAHRFRLVRVSPRRFFGYEEAREGPFAFPVAEPEKAIVDALCAPGLSGGAGLVASALGEALPSLDLERLLEYGTRMGSRTLCSRLGYLLERSGAAAEPIREAASAAYVKLDPAGPRAGRFVARWRIIDNLGGA